MYYGIYTPVGRVSINGVLEDNASIKAFKTKQEAKDFAKTVPGIRDYNIYTIDLYEEVSNGNPFDFSIDSKGNILFNNKIWLKPDSNGSYYFRKILDIINELREDNDLPKLQKTISERNEAPLTRRFNHSNPGECYLCPSCRHVYSIDSGIQGIEFQLNFCPVCGEDLSNEKIDYNIAAEIKSLTPKSSILDYGRF